MAYKTEQMICPRCRLPMNHHGEKLVEPRSAEEARRVKPNFEGLIEEIHACAGCSAVASRPGS